jgi:putative tryptophan/tyrosine transport system substrate-binding protein
MKQRDLVLLLGAMTVAHDLRAQQKAMPVIGYLSGSSAGPSAANVAAFREGLSEIGYVEGRNVAIEYRWAEGHYDRLPALAADLVGRKVDVIATGGGTNSTLVAKMPPLRFRSSSEPVATRSNWAWSTVSPGRAAISRAFPTSTPD